MEKDNKILLGAVLILLVAMVSFNFNTLTGEVTSAKTRATITVSPSYVYFNYNELNQQTTKSVELTVDVENGKVINEVWLCIIRTTKFIVCSFNSFAKAVTKVCAGFLE